MGLTTLIFTTLPETGWMSEIAPRLPQAQTGQPLQCSKGLWQGQGQPTGTGLGGCSHTTWVPPWLILLRTAPSQFPSGPWLRMDISIVLACCSLDNKASKQHLHAHICSSMSHSSQEEEAIQMSIHRGMDKLTVVKTQNRVWFNPCYNMDGPQGHYAEWNK